ncbi:hypothetical protein LX32DRAFT_312347 [Colletotrichum zoysiae]|uniref:Uncharacterized protein n=1 Tax=Colletotrichum zoysiae TaxID=1216348 RepID=A0AAD9HKL3_9PEZI|nr:hypothetical protein LX32DRAFT_312347 [Colletotrichum zoysiae]
MSLADNRLPLNLYCTHTTVPPDIPSRASSRDETRGCIQDPSPCTPPSSLRAYRKGEGDRYLAWQKIRFPPFLPVRNGMRSNIAIQASLTLRAHGFGNIRCTNVYAVGAEDMPAPIFLPRLSGGDSCCLFTDRSPVPPGSPLRGGGAREAGGSLMIIP